MAPEGLSGRATRKRQLAGEAGGEIPTEQEQRLAAHVAGAWHEVFSGALKRRMLQLQHMSFFAL
jgi:hypothetical protein